MAPDSGDRGTLAPLPEDHRRGLIVLTGISFLSLASTSLLWAFITYKLLAFRLSRFRDKADSEKHRTQAQGQGQRPRGATPDLSLGLDAAHHLARPCGGPVDINLLDNLDRTGRDMSTCNRRRDSDPESLGPDPGSTGGAPTSPRERTLLQRSTAETNPFPVLVYNLLFSDMMEALAYGLSVAWVARDGIIAPSPTCWAQGWLGSTSNLAASMFLAAISIHWFLAVVIGCKTQRWALYACTMGIWVFVLGLNAAGVIATRNKLDGPDTAKEELESYFMRANVWCWISSAHNSWRLWSHYFWIIVSITITLVLHAAVFCTLRRQNRSCRHLAPRRPARTELVERAERTPYESSATQRPPETPTTPPPPPPSGCHPAFLAYPFVYVLCITPLIVGRVAIIRGVDLGIAYFVFAGSLMAANGLLNSILWVTTMLFSAPEDISASGLGHLSFLRTPAREYGHTVVISGPASRGCCARKCQQGNGPGLEREEWWWWRSGGVRPWRRSRSCCADACGTASSPALLTRVGSGSASCERPYIKMDVVTQIAVECDGVGAGRHRADTKASDQESASGGVARSHQQVL